MGAEMVYAEKDPRRKGGAEMVVTKSRDPYTGKEIVSTVKVFNATTC